VRAVLIVMKKELWETLRDPMVLIMSLGFPILFFPLLIWGTTQLVILNAGLAETEPPRVVVAGVEAPGPGGVVDALLESPAVRGSGGEAALESGELDLIAVVQSEGSGLLVTVHHNSTLPRSARALTWAEDQLDRVREAREAELATAAGLASEALEVWRIKSVDVAPARQRMLSILAQSLPMILVVMLLVATVSPAVDIFVGERERGTLETSMVTTTSRWPLILGKTLAASAIGMVGAMGNLVAGGITFVHTMASLGAADTASLQLAPGPILLAMVPLIAGAVLVSALTFITIVPARTFKQAQSLSGFVTIGFIALVFTGMGEDAAPAAWTALVPGRNLMHCLSEGFRGVLAVDYALITTASSLALASVVLLAVHRIMSHEGYLFGPEDQGWRDAVRSLLPRRWSHR